MPRRFTTTLCTHKTRWDSGYAGGPGLSLWKIADEVFVDQVPGPYWDPKEVTSAGMLYAQYLIEAGQVRPVPPGTKCIGRLR